jgi:hypothetical protein
MQSAFGNVASTRRINPGPASQRDYRNFVRNREASHKQNDTQAFLVIGGARTKKLKDTSWLSPPRSLPRLSYHLPRQTTSFSEL